MKSVCFVDQFEGWIAGGGYYWPGILLHTTDGGNTWTTVLSDSSYALFSVFFTDIDNGWVVGSNGVILHTHDGGSSWEHASSGLASTCVSFLAINSNDQLFAVVYKEEDSMSSLFSVVYRTSDKGNTWARLPAPWGTTRIKYMDFNSSGNVFVITGTDVFRSVDDGDNWQTVGGTQSFSCFAIDSNDRIFAGTSYENVYRYDDNGTDWTQTGHWRVAPNFSVDAIAINSMDHIFVCTYPGIYRSCDNGENWELLATGPKNTTVNRILIGSDDCIYVGTSESVFRSSDNGNNWEQINNGMPQGSVDCLIINSSGHLFAGVASMIGNEGVYRLTDNGDNWHAVNDGLEYRGVNHFALHSSGVIFLGTFEGGVYRSISSTD